MDINTVPTYLTRLFELRSKTHFYITPLLESDTGVGKTTTIWLWATDIVKKFPAPCANCGTKPEHVYSNDPQECPKCHAPLKTSRIFRDWEKIKDDPDVMKNLLEKPDENFIFAHLRPALHDPVELNGYPRVNEEADFTRLVPLALAKLASTIPTILFIDEITNERRDNMFAAIMRTLDEHKIGSTPLHPDSFVIAACNPPRFSAIARPLPRPMLDRCVKIQVDRPNPRSWATYMDRMHGDNWDKRVFAFYVWKEDKIFADAVKENEDYEMRMFATLRGMEYIAVAWNAIGSSPADEVFKVELAEGKLGQTGSELVQFSEHTPPTFEEIAADPTKIASFDLEQKCLAALSIANKVVVEKAWPDVFKILAAVATMNDGKGQIGGKEYMAVILSMLPSTKQEMTFRFYKYVDGFISKSSPKFDPEKSVSARRVTELITSIGASLIRVK